MIVFPKVYRMCWGIEALSTVLGNQSIDEACRNVIAVRKRFPEYVDKAPDDPDE